MPIRPSRTKGKASAFQWLRDIAYKAMLITKTWSRTATRLLNGTIRFKAEKHRTLLAPLTENQVSRSRSESRERRQPKSEGLRRAQGRERKKISDSDQLLPIFGVAVSVNTRIRGKTLKCGWSPVLLHSPLRSHLKPWSCTDNKVIKPTITIDVSTAEAPQSRDRRSRRAQYPVRGPKKKYVWPWNKCERVHCNEASEGD